MITNSKIAVCTIKVNQLSQFLVVSADKLFLDHCSISETCLGQSLDNCNNMAFITVIQQIYRRYISTTYSNKPFKYIYPYENELTGRTFNLSVSISKEYAVTKIECQCLVNSSLEDYNTYINNYLMCIIEQSQENNKKYITYASQSFTSFINEHSINNDFFINHEIISLCEKTQLPYRKTSFIHDITHTDLAISISCIPSNQSPSRIFILFLHEIPLSTTNIISSIKALTSREFEIISYVSRGLTNRAISSELQISEGTVKKILSNAFKKLNISSRFEINNLYL